MTPRDLHHVYGRGVSPDQSPLIISIDRLEERSGFDPGVKLDLTSAKRLHVNFLFSHLAFSVRVPEENPLPLVSSSRAPPLVATGILTSQGGTTDATFAQFECYHFRPQLCDSPRSIAKPSLPHLIPSLRVLKGPLCCALPHLSDARQNANQFTSRQI
jgi:hypothetical protein